MATLNEPGRQRRRQAAKRAAAHARLLSVRARRPPYTSARPHIGLATRTRPAPSLLEYQHFLRISKSGILTPFGFAINIHILVFIFKVITTILYQ